MQPRQPDDQREPGVSGGSEQYAAPEVLPGPILPHHHAAWGPPTSAKVCFSKSPTAKVFDLIAIGNKMFCEAKIFPHLARQCLPAIISYHIFKLTPLLQQISVKVFTFPRDKLGSNYQFFPLSYSMQSAMSPMSSSAMNSYNSFSTNNMMSSSISAAM